MKKLFREILAMMALTAIIVVAVMSIPHQQKVKATCSTATINGQCIFTDAAPTISACGTSPTVPGFATSNGGTVTVGKSPTDIYGHILPTTNCTITFATAFTAIPVVVATPLSTGYGYTMRVINATTAGATFAFSADAGGSKFNYLAF